MRAEARIKWRLFRKLLPGYALFFGFLIGIDILYGFIAQGCVGTLILFAVFVSLRNKYRNGITYHAETTKRCIALSVALFGVSAIPLIGLNMRVSLIFSVPVGIAMTWFLHVVGVKKDLERKLSVPVKKFDLDNCTEAELIERCKERFKRDVEYKTERAIKHFILKLPHEEIDVNVEQSKKERYRFRKILK